MSNTSASTLDRAPANGQDVTAPTPIRTQAQRLREPFDYYFTDTRGGANISFVDGFQVTERLLDVLGWFDFRILHQAIHEEADEAWVHGQLRVVIDGHEVTVEQFGSQKLHRSASVCSVCGKRANSYHDQNAREAGVAAHKAAVGGKGELLDIGFDWKGAGTDCLKKCASLIGVGLYLSRKDGTPVPGTKKPANASRDAQQRGGGQQQQRGEGGGSDQQRPQQPAQQQVIKCQEDTVTGPCPRPLEPHEFNDGKDGKPNTVWTPGQLANRGQTEFKKVLCWEHLSARRQAKKDQEAAAAR